MAYTSAGMTCRPRLRNFALWGLLFSGLFYGWSLAYGPLPWLGLLVVRGLPWALLALPGMLLEKRGCKAEWQQALGFGAGLALTSWALLVGPTGNDWETPAGAFTQWPAMLSTLPDLGLMGFAGVLGTGCALVACPGKRSRLAGVLTLVLFAASSTALYLTSPPSRLPDLKVALLQTGWSQEEKWDQNGKQRGIDLLLGLTEQAKEKGAQLVIWPETAWPNRGMRHRFHDTRRIGKLARRLATPILASSIEDEDQGWYNSASLVNESGKFTQEYRKERLAPFAEYLPLPPYLESRLRAIPPFSYIGHFRPGQEHPLMAVGPYRFRVLICFESMVPGPALKSNSEVDFFVVLTNDAPMIYDWPKEDHFRSAILRAAQCQKPVYQASNNGITGIVDADGSVVARTAPGDTGKHLLLSP